jgi:hypothetical protein
MSIALFWVVTQRLAVITQKSTIVKNIGFVLPSEQAINNCVYNMKVFSFYDLLSMKAIFWLCFFD